SRCGRIRSFERSRRRAGSPHGVRPPPLATLRGDAVDHRPPGPEIATFEVTAYSLHGTTAAGTRPQPGIVAADPPGNGGRRLADCGTIPGMQRSERFDFEKLRSPHRESYFVGLVWGGCVGGEPHALDGSRAPRGRERRRARGGRRSPGAKD